MYPSGYVDKSTFKNVYFKDRKRRRTKGAEMYLDNVFQAYDVDNNHTVDCDEFIMVLGMLCRGTTEEKLQWMFSVFDMNHDGSITKTEMLCIIRALYKMVRKLKGTNRTPESHVKHIFKRYDLNEDDLLSLDEFMEIQTTEPELMKAMCSNELNIGI